MKKEFKAELEQLKEDNLYREMRVLSGAPESKIDFEGRQYLNFSSNNYLSLASHPIVKKAAVDAVEKYGCSGTSSRLLGGTLGIHAELEEKLAKFKKKEKALVFPSGFQANIGIISTLLETGDAVIMDRLNHASLWDAAKLSKARIFVYEHCDMGSLEKVLKRTKEYTSRLVVTDSLFSMDGDIAPLKDIAALCAKYDALSMIDEAHATGVFGETGAGLAEFFKVEDKIDLIMGTLSKALGSQGGFVCASADKIEYLINKARSFIYTTAPAPAVCAAAAAAIEMLKNEPDRRKTVLENAKYFRDGLAKLGFDTMLCSSQIVPVMTGGVEETLKLSGKLFKEGIYAPAIRPPTVPDGQCRLRFSLVYDHSREDMDKVLKVLGS